MNSTDGTTAGVTELLASYGGGTLTVTSYDNGMQSGDGAGFAYISVACPGGAPHPFLQPFDSSSGHWQATIYSPQDYPPPTPDTAPATDGIPVATSAGPTDTAAAAAEAKYGLYEPCP